jgi:hypothetical protein
MEPTPLVSIPDINHHLKRHLANLLYRFSSQARLLFSPGGLMKCQVDKMTQPIFGVPCSIPLRCNVLFDETSH